jgi:hypothetical protein
VVALGNSWVDRHGSFFRFGDMAPLP